MASARTGHNQLDDRLIERCEEIPATPQPGAYVVIDTLHFSNTVIELLATGAEYVHVPDERGEEFDYRAEHPRTLVGGDHTDEYDPAGAYDFFNSPSFVAQLDVDGRPVSMTSTNGGRSVATLCRRGGKDVDVYVGAPLNARSVGEYLRTRDQLGFLVSAGTNGDVAIEDHVGATLISRYLDGIPPATAERTLFRQQIETARGPEYAKRATSGDATFASTR